MTVRVKARKYGSLPSCQWWGLHLADDETHRPLDTGIHPKAYRRRDAVAVAEALGWEVVR